MTDLNKLFGKEHPFLTEPGFWIIAGHGMSGEPLDRVPIQGRMQVNHEDGRIVVLGEMSMVSRSNPMAFQTRYEMVPSADELVLDFFQANEPSGDMKGRVVVFDERLVSTYTSGDGSLTGCEILHRMGDNRYAATGTLLEKGNPVNIWKLDLVRPAKEVGQEEQDPAGKA